MIEYRPAPGFTPSVATSTVRLIVQLPLGGGVLKQVPPSVPISVFGSNSSEVTAALVLYNRPASTRGGPSGGLSRYAM